MDSVHYKIIYMMDNYAALSVTAERAAYLAKDGMKIGGILKNLQGFEVEEPVRTKLLKMNLINGLTVLEGYMVKTMRTLAENRLRELDKNKKNEQEIYEAQQLTKYLDLISDSRGLLQVPPKIDAEENGLVLLDRKNKVIENKNGVDYVRLRNPWGGGAVEHVRNPITGNVTIRKSEDRYGTFLVDINTFVTYFGDITAT